MAKLLKDTLFKSVTTTILFAITIIATAAISYYVNDYLTRSGNSKDKIISEVNKVLDKYSDGLNTHNFNAYDLFSNPVDEFITMKNTSPTEINDYINRYYYHQFIKPTVTFDKQSVAVNYTDANGSQVDVVENDEFIRATTGKVEQHQTKARIYFTKDYKIKVFTLYKIIF